MPQPNRRAASGGPARLQHVTTSCENEDAQGRCWPLTASCDQNTSCDEPTEEEFNGSPQPAAPQVTGSREIKVWPGRNAARAVVLENEKALQQGFFLLRLRGRDS